MMTFDTGTWGSVQDSSEAAREKPEAAVQDLLDRLPGVQISTVPPPLRRTGAAGGGRRLHEGAEVRELSRKAATLQRVTWKVVSSQVFGTV